MSGAGADLADAGREPLHTMSEDEARKKLEHLAPLERGHLRSWELCDAIAVARALVVALDTLRGEVAEMKRTHVRLPPNMGIVPAGACERCGKTDRIICECPGSWLRPALPFGGRQ